MKKSLLLILGVASALTFTSCSTDVKEVADTVEAEGKDMADKVAEEATKMKDKVVSPETIKLEQTHAKFSTTELNLEAGKEYSFEVLNNAGRPAAFVLAPKPAEGATKDEIMATVIGDAMLAGVLEDGQSGTSKSAVKLEAGEYIYFCPMNETPHYAVTVK